MWLLPHSTYKILDLILIVVFRRTGLLDAGDKKEKLYCLGRTFVSSRSETRVQREEQHALSLCCIIEDECWVRSGMSACWIIYITAHVGPHPVVASSASANPAPPVFPTVFHPCSVWFPTSRPRISSQLLHSKQVLFLSWPGPTRCHLQTSITAEIVA